MENKPKFQVGDIVTIKGEERIAQWIITAISIQRDIMPIHAMEMPTRDIIYHLECAQHDPRYPHLHFGEPQLLEECLEHAGNAIERIKSRLTIERIKRKLTNGK